MIGGQRARLEQAARATPGAVPKRHATERVHCQRSMGYSKSAGVRFDATVGIA
jgi:hypothetical protein